MLTYYVQTSLTGLFLLTIIYIDFSKQSGERKPSQKLFLALLFSNALLHVFELLLNVFNGTGYAHSATLMKGIVTVFYILSPLPGVLWILFVENWIRREETLRRRLVLLISLPFLVNGLAVIASITGGYLFTIDSSGSYLRGRYFFVMVLASYSYHLFAGLRLVRCRMLIRRQELFALLFFAVPPILAGLLQSLFFGISIIWLAMSFSLLIIYLNVQGTNLYSDHLTGLANRRKLDSYLKYIANRKGRRLYGGIMLDVDRFKQINDVYGHDVGDRVLEAVSSILRRTFQHGDLVARYGGDEFIIILTVPNTNARKLLEMVESLQENIATFNSHGRFPSKLSLSMGHAIFRVNEGMSQEAFLRKLDQRMYSHKSRLVRSGQAQPADT